MIQAAIVTIAPGINRFYVKYRRELCILSL